MSEEVVGELESLRKFEAEAAESEVYRLSGRNRDGFSSALQHYGDLREQQGREQEKERAKHHDDYAQRNLVFRAEQAEARVVALEAAIRRTCEDWSGLPPVILDPLKAALDADAVAWR